MTRYIRIRGLGVCILTGISVMHITGPTWEIFFFDKNKTTACDCKRESTKASKVTAVMQMKVQTQRSQIANPEELNTQQ